MLSKIVKKLKWSYINKLSYEKPVLSSHKIARRFHNEVRPDLERIVNLIEKVYLSTSKLQYVKNFDTSINELYTSCLSSNKNSKDLESKSFNLVDSLLTNLEITNLFYIMDPKFCDL